MGQWVDSRGDKGVYSSNNWVHAAADLDHLLQHGGGQDAMGGAGGAKQCRWVWGAGGWRGHIIDMSRRIHQ